MITSCHPFSLAASNSVVFSVYVVFPAEIRLSLSPELSFGCGFTSGDTRHTPSIFSLLTVSVAFRSFVRCLALAFDVLPVFLVMFSGSPYLCLKGSGHIGSGAFVSCGGSTFWPFGCDLFLHRPNVLLVPLPDVFAGYFFKVGGLSSLYRVALSLSGPPGSLVLLAFLALWPSWLPSPLALLAP